MRLSIVDGVFHGGVGALPTPIPPDSPEEDHMRALRTAYHNKC